MASLQELALSRGNRGLMIVALVAALIAAVLVFVALSSNDDGGNAPVTDATTKSVVVATQDIAAGDEVSAAMVNVIQVPDSILVKGAYADSALIVGQRTRYGIAQGEQITPSKIGTVVKGEGLQFVVPEGKRAVALSVQELTAFGGLGLPGNHVDVIAVYKIKNAPGLAENEYILRTETILQNVELLAIAQEAQEPVPKPTEGENPQDTNTTTSGQLPAEVEEQPRAGTATVALSPEEVQVLIDFQQRAERVWLSLRPFGDSAPIQIAPHDVVVVE